MKKVVKKKTKSRPSAVLEEVRHIEEIEYGTKELIHGVLIGILIGFFIALMLMG